MNFGNYIRRQINWSKKTFGPNDRLKGVLEHIRQELIEVEEHPKDASEWADIIILAIDGAWRQGLSAERIVDALKKKQEKNFNRVWPDWRGKSENEPINHDRSKD
jgi:hypothetical protein